MLKMLSYKKSLLTLGAFLFSILAYSQDIVVAEVKNSIKLGPLAGNRKLEFGVKNILEEYLQESGYNLSPSSKNQIFAELIYMDVLTTKSNLSIFHKDDNAVVIRMKGYIVRDGKKSKEYIVEEQATEVSTSTLIISNDGKFNQQNLSTAIKKSCNSLVNKLL
jgi:uncharacterized lipoprotein YajG